MPKSSRSVLLAAVASLAAVLVSPAVALDDGPFACGLPASPISSVQGAGAASPLQGQTVEVEAVVVAAFQREDELGGLFLQEDVAEQDADSMTSEGLFAQTLLPARVGDRVRLRGVVAESEGLTELSPVEGLLVCASGQPLPAPADLTWPPESVKSLEALENMRVRLPQALTVVDTYALGRFGELAVANERLMRPGPLDRLIIDDGRSGKDLPLVLNGQDNRNAFGAGNPIRTGQAVIDPVGVLYFAHGSYRLQPTAPLVIDPNPNPRRAAPEPVGGTLRVASFNVLNYFSSLSNEGPVCGPAQNQECRGADSALEQSRQLAKLVAALGAVDADILGLIELENNAGRSLEDITHALNAALGEPYYDFVRSGAIGQDVIKVGLLFRPETVAAEGHFAVLGRAVDPRFDDTLNRPVLAQAFRERLSGVQFTVAVAHLKSKGCSGAEGSNQDQGDGQGCFNPVRAAAAEAMADWALSGPTGPAAAGVLILGDFNSYRDEDPIRVLEGRGLVNLLARFQGPGAYTYVYAGIAGALDYAFSTPGLAQHVTGATVWHINADESPLLDYNEEPGRPAAYFAADPYRSSDHDPVIVGLQLAGWPAADPGEAATGQPELWRVVVGLALLLFLALGWWALRRRTR